MFSIGQIHATAGWAGTIPQEVVVVVGGTPVVVCCSGKGRRRPRGPSQVYLLPAAARAVKRKEGRTRVIFCMHEGRPKQKELGFERRASEVSSLSLTRKDIELLCFSF